MTTVKVLCFAADPLSAPPHGHAPRLRLDDEVRQIRHHVRLAEHRDALEFDVRLAARPDDLLQALYEARPHVVHFSGHGNAKGLLLMSPDGRTSHPVDAATLAQLFRAFRGEVRVVLLNACFSLPQAQAIADVVGCAIGTRGTIFDDAAMTFAASFYRAVGFGESVQVAFEQARTAVALEHPGEDAVPELVVRADVDPAALILVAPAERDPAPRAPRASVPADAVAHPPSPPSAPPVWRRRGMRWVAPTTASAVLSLGAAAYLIRAGERTPAEGAGGASSASMVVADSTPSQVPPRPMPTSDSVVVASAPGPVEAGVPASVPAAADPSPGSRLRTPVTPERLAAAREHYRVRDFAAALPIFRDAAEVGSSEAMGYVGIMYLDGRGTAKQPAAAIPWLERARDAGDARGINALGVAYMSGEGVRRDYHEAMRLYQAAQGMGYADAMVNIATLYRLGWGVPRNYDSAFAWFQRAHHAGAPDGTMQLGSMFEFGMSVPRDMNEARTLFSSAAAAGSALAMVRLGRMYEDGDGVRRDYEEARTWYQKAADAGSVEATYNLGVLYYHGRGVPESRREAIRRFREAADAGFARAQATLEALQTR